MHYQTYQPHADLEAFIKCYWTLEVPAEMGGQRQRIIPDGCIEMFFILGDDVKRYTSDDKFIIQPRAMILGQITEPLFIEPIAHVNTFAIRFYPYGFANFMSIPLKQLSNKETPLAQLFGKETAEELDRYVRTAPDTAARITIIESFLFKRLNDRLSIDNIVKDTVDALLLSSGNATIKEVLKNDPSKRRQLERKFTSQIGMSPKQLGKVIRLQAALKMMLEPRPESLAKIAYDNDYYDQAHFSKDFKEFTGTAPKDFFADQEMILSTLFYKQ